MKKLRLNSRARKAFQGSSRGFTLIEVVIAIALIGIIAVAVLSALSTASISLIIADKRATAESLARSQMEYVKNQDYIYYSESGHEDYDVICVVIMVCPEDYTVEVVAEPIDPDTYQPYNEDAGVFDYDDGIQKITVIVSYDSEVVITMEGYKRNPEIEE